MAGRRVIVTRVQPQADQWVAALQAAGLSAQAWPLIELGPCADPRPVQQAWADLPACHAVMAVSAAAVHHFFTANQQLSLDGRALAALKTRAWAVGPATALAWAQAGWPRARIDSPPASAAQLDSEALWAQVAPGLTPGQRVCIVRGDDEPEADAPAQPAGPAAAHGGAAPPAAPDAGAGRDWLIQRLRAAGVQTHVVVAYQRSLPQWSAAQCAAAHTALADGSLWLFSSAQALAHLHRLLPSADLRAACALVTHPRIAQAARSLGWGHVQRCAPQRAAVIASIESFA